MSSPLRVSPPQEYRAVGAKTRGGWCRDHCLSIRALQRAEDVYAQLSRAAEQARAPGPGIPRLAPTAAT